MFKSIVSFQFYKDTLETNEESSEKKSEKSPSPTDEVTDQNGQDVEMKDPSEDGKV